MPNLQQLITEQKRLSGYSYDEYANRSGHVISRQRWQQLATGQRIKEFSEPPTLQAMADALEVDITLVVLAMAKSLGLQVGTQQSDLALLMPPSARHLTPEQRDAIIRLVRVFTPPGERNGMESDPATRTSAEVDEDQKTLSGKPKPPSYDPKPNSPIGGFRRTDDAGERGAENRS